MSTNTLSGGSDAIFSLRIKTEDIPPQGLSGTLSVSGPERSAVASKLDLEEIASLDMEYELQRVGARRFRLKGHVNAAVTQRCVVTLEPLNSEIDEHFEVELWPEEEVEKFEFSEDEDGAAVSLDGPEPIVDQRIDVGQLAYEHLAAALDPYPRKPGAEFKWRDPHADTSDDSGTKPFAELRNLMRENDKSTR